MCKNKVSVIIPTYKQKGTLKSTIESVLNQSYENLEIIVVDDNNPDTIERKETETIVGRIIERSNIVKYYKHSTNLNGSAARNTGIRKSTGDYIMFLDDDDEFLPEKIKVQVSQLENSDDKCGGSYTKYIRYKDGKIYDKCGESRRGNLLVEQLSRNLFIQAGSNLMIKRKVVNEIGFFDEKFNRNQDIEYMVRFFKKFEISYCDVLGLKINIYKKNTIENGLKTTKLFYRTFKKDIDESGAREYILKHLLLQEIRYYILYKDFTNLRKAICKSDLEYVQIIRYFFYLISRKITKYCRGFEIK